MRKPNIKLLGRELVWGGQYLKMVRRAYLDRNGNPRHWEFISRKSVVFVFPITQDGNVVLVRQYRIPQQKFVIEMPAGVCDKPGETKKTAARRELREETGFSADKLIELRPIRGSSAAIQGDVNIFLALNAKRVGKPMLDESEDIEVLEVPFQELVSILMSETKETIIDSNVLAVWAIVKHLRLAEGKNG